MIWLISKNVTGDSELSQLFTSSKSSSASFVASVRRLTFCVNAVLSRLAHIRTIHRMVSAHASSLAFAHLSHVPSVALKTSESPAS